MANIKTNIGLLESESFLTTTEKEIFDILRNVCNMYEPPVVARVVGGWVRDKLLGIECDDLDISLEGTSGPEFAKNVKFLIDAKIQTNPCQSEHLESAKICLSNDFWIDVCQLRCDEYNEDSRIPNIRIGCPEEDSLRRDITINALFYNINTQKVEDFQNGLIDLENKCIRTTYDPLLSFNDDPLRILRAFRFASRFGFNICNEIINAAQYSRECFHHKLAKQRIEMELKKALSGPNPFIYIELLLQSGLFSEIFDVNNEFNLDIDDIIKRSMIVSKRISNFPDYHYSIALAVIYYQVYQNNILVIDPINKRKKIKLLEYAISRNILSSSDIYNVTNSNLQGSKTVQDIKALERVTVGNWIRSTGKLWRYSSLLIFDEEFYSFFEETLVPYIMQENLQNAYEIVPIINGKELAKIHNVKPGPIISVLIKRLIDWQLLNPNGTVDDYVNSVNHSN